MRTNWKRSLSAAIFHLITPPFLIALLLLFGVAYAASIGSSKVVSDFKFDTASPELGDSLETVLHAIATEHGGTCKENTRQTHLFCKLGPGMPELALVQTENSWVVSETTQFAQSGVMLYTIHYFSWTKGTYYPEAHEEIEEILSKRLEPFAPVERRRSYGYERDPSVTF